MTTDSTPAAPVMTMKIPRKMLWYQWMDYLATAAVFLALAPFVRAQVRKVTDVSVISWYAMYFTVLLGPPFIVLLCLSLTETKASVVIRGIVQLLLLSLVLFLVAEVEAAHVGDTRKQESFGNAADMILALTRDHQRHGKYPESFPALEAELGQPLPNPALGWYFDYHTYGDEFTLVVRGGWTWREYLSAEDPWGFFGHRAALPEHSNEVSSRRRKGPGCTIVIIPPAVA